MSLENESLIPYQLIQLIHPLLIQIWSQLNFELLILHVRTFTFIWLNCFITKKCRSQHASIQFTFLLGSYSVRDDWNLNAKIEELQHASKYKRILLFPFNAFAAFLDIFKCCFCIWALQSTFHPGVSCHPSTQHFLMDIFHYQFFY